MKKVFTIVLLAMLALCILTGCDNKVVDITGNERKIEYGLITVDWIGDRAEICYDPATMVCYLKVRTEQKLSICPYYVVNEWGEPEIAIYGDNWFGPGEGEA